MLVLPLRLGVTLVDTLPDGDSVAESVPLPLPLRLGVIDALGEGVPEPDRDGVADVDGDSVGESEAVCEAETVLVTVPLPVRLVVSDGDGEPDVEAETLPVCDTVPAFVVEGVEETVGLTLALRLAVTLVDGLGLELPLRDGVTLGEGLDVPEIEAVSDAEVLPDREGVTLVVAEIVPLLESVPELEGDIVADTVPDTDSVTDGDGDGVPLPLRLAVGLTEPLTVPLPLGDAVLVACCDAEPVGEGDALVVGDAGARHATGEAPAGVCANPAAHEHAPADTLKSAFASLQHVVALLAVPAPQAAQVIPNPFPRAALTLQDPAFL